jgi:hypothetical protein
MKLSLVCALSYSWFYGVVRVSGLVKTLPFVLRTQWLVFYVGLYWRQPTTLQED